MSRCLNCNYKLVLLERRHKFKCPKCSSLFTEEEIKLEEFCKRNKKIRNEEKEEIEKELQKIIRVENKKLTEEEMYERKIAIQGIWREKHREAYNKYKREYWAKHRERLLARRRENYAMKKGKILE